MIRSDGIVGLVRQLEKFRSLILTLFVILAVLTAISYYFSVAIAQFLSGPLDGRTLYYLSPVDGITVRLKIAFTSALVLFLPVLLYGLAFLFRGNLAPGLRKILVFAAFPAAIFLFFSGMAFSYTTLVPVSIRFLLSCGDGFLTPMLSGDGYYSFVLLLILLMGLFFEMPLVILLLSRFGLVTYKLLSKHRRGAILFIFIAGAILTPTPDAFTLLIAATPLVALYEIGVWLAFFFGISRKKEVPVDGN